MKLTHSFKAFIISFLITGNLALLLWGYQISSGLEDTQEEAYDIVYDQELVEELIAAQEAANNKPIETHRAFNQSQKSIAQAKFKSDADADQFNDRLAALDDAMDALKKAKEEEVVVPEKNFVPQNSDETIESNNSNSTNSYRLVDRTALYFPNPVYTCQAPGTVVVNITVDGSGAVSQMAINESSSTTTNQCLWDMALKYAKEAVFSKSSRLSQLGTITYRFPGQ